MLGSGQFLSYLDNVCGYQFDSKCEYPDRQGSATAQLNVQINPRTAPTDILIEIDGLLSPANEFVILKAIRLYGHPE